MPPPRLLLVPLSVGLGLLFTSSLWGVEKLPAPMPAGPAASSCDAPCACVPPCPTCPPRVVVELSQPEVHFAAPCNQGGGCQKQPCCQGHGKSSLVSINISKVRGGFFGSGPLGAAAAPQAVTSVVPAFATA